MYVVKIKKEQLPYETKIVINGDLFKFEFMYNVYDERIYCNLYDKDNNLLAIDEPLTLGQIMFARIAVDDAGHIRNGFPKAIIVPNYFDSAKTDKIWYNNIDEWALFIEEV